MHPGPVAYGFQTAKHPASVHVQPFRLVVIGKARSCPFRVRIFPICREAFGDHILIGRWLLNTRASPGIMNLVFWVTITTCRDATPQPAAFYDETRDRHLAGGLAAALIFPLLR